MNMELMKLVEEVADFMYDKNKSEMMELTGTEEGAAKMDGLAFALLKASKTRLDDNEANLNGKEIALAGNVLSLFCSAFLFAKACKIVDRHPVEPTAMCEDLSFVVRKYMECVYLTSAVDRKNAGMALIKRIDEMNFSLSKVFTETTGVDMESISYIFATRLAMNANLEEIRDIAVDTVRYP